jgi:hypothetical protein
MNGLTSTNTLELPKELLFKAPTCWSEHLWFDKEKHEDRNFDINCEQAVIAEGIGERECPTIGEWIAFSITGAIIAALSEKYIVLPDPEPLDWRSNVEHYIWEALWQAVQENETKLNRTFVAAMLRSFLPREYHAPPDRPYQTSNFVRHWISLEYPDTFMSSVGNVRLIRLQEGRKAIALLPEDVADSIRLVGQYVSSMLDMAIKRIKKTCNW